MQVEFYCYINQDALIKTAKPYTIRIESSSQTENGCVYVGSHPEAEIGLAEGVIPMGSILVIDSEIVGRGLSIATAYLSDR